MNSRPNPATPVREDRRASLRSIPAVDEVLSQPEIVALVARIGRRLVTEATRRVLSDLRTELSSSAPETIAELDRKEVVSRVIVEVERTTASSLVRVINATGVVLHTNLGRAPLPEEAVRRLAAVATHYSNLEYDVPSGKRGKRDVHTLNLLAQLLGAESAIVVNNNAAAVFLVLNTVAKGAEVIVSRGELIEIGDGFRIPDIMVESGAVLREVGTTNRTRITDYERAINENTKLLLRVHPSNFRITGFTERPALDDMVALGRRYNLPVFEDLGSGCLFDLSPNGISEPLAEESFSAGVPLVSFSGDKLLGGPQAGIIAGKKEIVERVRRNPLFRALRVDKLTIGVLEVILGSYLRGAADEIPALRMIRLSPEALNARATAFVQMMRAHLPSGCFLEIHTGFSVIGGGSTPDQQLPTSLVAVSSVTLSPAEIEERLRLRLKGAPVIGRIESDRVVLDLRTVFPDEEADLATALADALR